MAAIPEKDGRIMRKAKIAGGLLLASALFLTACGGTTPPLAFNVNWYYNTTRSKSNVENTRERLEYAVTFESTPQNGLSLEYTDGKYVTELKNDTVTTENESFSGYVYTTELNISVRFTLNGESSEVFQDYVKTGVEFRSAYDGLKPVRSWREVVTHSPTESYTSLVSSFATYSFRYEVDYNADLTEAASKYYASLTEEVEPEERTYDVSGTDTFLDNEQIEFALRGLDMTTIPSFRSINMVTGKVQSLSFRAAPTETTERVEFEMDGRPVLEEALPAYSLILSYTGNNSGQPQTLLYAKKADDPLANTYRNVLLKMEVPVLQSLGTLVYKLTSASFIAS